MEPMSRDRKSLCLVLAIAMVSQAMLFAMFYQINSSPSVAEALQDATSCQTTLTRIYSRYGAGHRI